MCIRSHMYMSRTPYYLYKWYSNDNYQWGEINFKDTFGQGNCSSRNLFLKGNTFRVWYIIGGIFRVNNIFMWQIHCRWEYFRYFYWLGIFFGVRHTDTRWLMWNVYTLRSLWFCFYSWCILYTMYNLLPNLIHSQQRCVFETKIHI